MTLSERLSEYVRACFTGIWVRSFEHDDDRAGLAAGDELRVECLDDFGRAQEPVEIAQDQDRGPVIRTERAEGFDGRKRIRRTR